MKSHLRRFLADAYSASANDNGGKSDSVANLQPQPSLNSIQSSPGPKRSTNTLKKWLTSPVRRLNSGKTESHIKKQKKVRDGRKSFDLGSPKTGDETTPQGDSADEVCGGVWWCLLWEIPCISSVGCESCWSKCSSPRVWRKQRIIHKIALLQTALGSKEQWNI